MVKQKKIKTVFHGVLMRMYIESGPQPGWGTNNQSLPQNFYVLKIRSSFMQWHNNTWLATTWLLIVRTTFTNRDEQSTTTARHGSVKFNKAADKMGTLWRPAHLQQVSLA